MLFNPSYKLKNEVWWHWSDYNLPFHESFRLANMDRVTALLFMADMCEG